MFNFTGRRVKETPPKKEEPFTPEEIHALYLSTQPGWEHEEYAGMYSYKKKMLICVGSLYDYYNVSFNDYSLDIRSSIAKQMYENILNQFQEKNEKGRAKNTKEFMELK